MQDLQSGWVGVGRWSGWLIGLLSLLVSTAQAQDSLQRRSLGFYLEQGLLNSPLLKENTNAIGLNRLDSLLNVAVNKPYLQGIGQVLYAPANQRFGYDQNNTNGGLYSGIVQVNRNLLYRKNLRIQNNLNAALRDSLVNTIRINQNDLQKSIIDLYLIAYQDYQQMTIFNDLFIILNRQNELLKSLLRSAIFAQSDYLAFRVDLQQSEINYEGAKIQYLQDLLALNTLCNIPDVALVRLEKPTLSLRPNFSLDDNPYLLRFRFDSLIIEGNRRIIDIFYRPTLDLYANAGSSAIAVTDIGRRLGYSVGMNIAIPIYNGNQRRLQYQKLTIAQVNIQNYRGQYINRFNLRLRTVNEQLRVNQTLLGLTEKQNTDVENLLTISQARLYRGDMSAIDYLLIVQRYLNIKLALNQLSIQRQRLVSEFNYRNY